ncbi:MAG: IS1634 family transposase [Sulfurimicrobium sp.]|nr:IS1634 family transposase [Thiobacillus sp.]MDP2962838.1 IS1634 family transposase [Sulfurimicrobium sp.]
MYIRRVTTRRTASGETYHSYRLVESRREGGRVRQVALLNLGRHFDLPEAHWPALCARLDQLLGRQGVLVPVDLPEAVETHAQAFAARFVARAPVEAGAAEFVEIDVASLELVQPRSVGVEHVGLHALAQLELDPLLASLGVNAITRAMILTQIVGRMAAPGSELATWGWLNDASALPELLDLSLPDLSIMRLYRAADVLMKHQAAIETHLFGRVRDLFGLEATVTLYDLTNTYFEGAAAAIPKAKRGHSKEKRSDCPLLTLGLVLDASGFVRRSRVLAGNAVECRTLEGMLKDLDAPAGALVVMDRGIATEANLAWLREQGYRYLVVSRERGRNMPQGEMTLTTAGGDTVQVERVLDEAAGEVRLYCHSPRRALKEAGINQRFCTRFEAGLKKLADGLDSPRGARRPELIHERIGRLKQASFGVARHYTIRIETNPEQTEVTHLAWEKTPVAGTMLTDPGVYCLRSNETGWSEEQLWRTYMMLTDLESVFRSLKSELGLRPVYHLKAERADGHLFISVLAYQCVQLIRRQLKAKGIDQRWTGLRETLSVQRRVTARFTQKDGRTLNVRRATQPEPKLKAIYDALGLNLLPGGVKKIVA